MVDSSDRGGAAKRRRALRLKRRSIELGPLEAWLSQGRRVFHFENLQFSRHVLRTGLKLAGLLTRGEKNALRPVTRLVRFEFESLPAAFSGFRILHLSDLHIDGHPELADTIGKHVEKLEVDLTLLTGDYRFDVSGPCHNVYAGMRRVLPAIKSRYGIIGILGNHDFEEEVPELEAMGVRMLVNDAFELRLGSASIWLVGLDDPHYYGCSDLVSALNDVPRDAFKILLVHSPEIIPEAEAAGFQLYLCGHTHAGQVCVPVLGPILVHAGCPRAFIRGRWEYGRTQGYTSAGVGCSLLPVRFCCPPEIGVLELHRCDPSKSS
jgi:predicted MPP superfamily phosphohydrolase